ncbi:hypothetical protein N665_0217s0012 [Sinapis alba]|nr:hypothetical protein N665_0217s0012 [Sinapis alba]
MPPALQAWSLSDIPSRPEMFPLSSIYANMDYLLWRKNNFDGVELDRDPYPWIIWYIWKARNDKLFKGIDRDPLKLVRFAETECKAWFDANEQMAIISQDNNRDEPQVISLENICMVDGSWTATTMYSGCGWIWKDIGRKIQLMGMRNLIRKESALHSEVEALRWAMESMVQYSPCQNFETYCKDLIAMVREPKKWPRFAT